MERESLGAAHLRACPVRGGGHTGGALWSATVCKSSQVHLPLGISIRIDVEKAPQNSLFTGTKGKIHKLDLIKM